MMQRRLVRWAIGLLVILLFAFTVREFPVLAVLVALLAGLAALVHRISARRPILPGKALDPEVERDKHEHFRREIPPLSG